LFIVPEGQDERKQIATRKGGKRSETPLKIQWHSILNSELKPPDNISKAGRATLASLPDRKFSRLEISSHCKISCHKLLSAGVLSLNAQNIGSWRSIDVKENLDELSP
jgi:hypothetical protein